MYFPPVKYASHRLPQPSHSQRSPSSSPIASIHDFGVGERLPDLYDQLLSSPETRFHAVYLFMRYWYLLMADAKEKERIQLMQAAAAVTGDDGDDEVPSMGWKLVVWDCCLACLAISVKMHRDFLRPLEPVLAWEFEALAPHVVAYDDLELAHRDVLEVLQYRLGGTPQQLLDELWLALLSLQQLLDFRNGWRFVQKEVWWRLFDAVAGASKPFPPRLNPTS
ncbi:hypothetical protein R3P38DRAFT_2956112 [Favolaschia claudopus]|uniref:Cyclin N-terminal domain-containing protein n=1 Tax=Favolaschia claudopus TaxID=2862362 RepID=A0AAW0BDL6_9AGAR